RREERSVIYEELREEAREEVRREERSVIYEELREEAREEVRREERLEEGRSLVFRLLARKVGEVPTITKSQIAALGLTQLEDLGEALLNFATLADLDGWLERLPE
ncbi:MAG: DUF4351 domain-containing protein, partial [Leptolyngbyaceae cyanobacterium SM1_4_3]|nr:DUF4351 domain-containing protein [Leptolyngbyaceae cyanobacterium SM1_4_3]